QLFKILELMGSPMAGKCQHLNFGLIKSKDGSMSTRRGKVVFLQDIIDQTQEEMHDVMKANEAKYAHIADPLAVADNVAVSSIVVQDMSARRHLDYEFDWGRMLSFEGDTGPYLQYAHARLCSIERQAQPLKPLATWEEIAATSGALTEPQAAALLRALAAWPDVLTDASVSYEPCTIVKYALRMSRDVSRAVEALYVRNQPEDIARARLTLFVAARKVLGQTLSMIGLRPLERM
ncbi:anticodon-binding domain of a subclass of class I aminoacyl-tRNA synthetase, partial [Caulochytrium protostelioides]